MEALRLNNVVFCGENPGMMLMSPGTDTATADLSYWFCTYSPHGEGHVLFLRLDEANASALNHPAVAIYSDNAPLARYLAEMFTQYFDGWSDKDLPNAPILPARIFKESDSRSFYRVACHGEQTHIELMWQDVRDISFRTFPDMDFTPNRFQVATVFFLCGKATISINQQPVTGEPQVKTREDGRLSSTAFVALAETWIKVESPTA